MNKRIPIAASATSDSRPTTELTRAASSRRKESRCCRLASNDLFGVSWQSDNAQNYMKYLLEVGQRGVVEQKYSYGRLALGVLRFIEFEQESLCEEVEPLLQRFKTIFEPRRFFGRITNTETDEVIFTNKSEFDY